MEEHSTTVDWRIKEYVNQHHLTGTQKTLFLARQEQVEEMVKDLKEQGILRSLVFTGSADHKNDGSF